MSDDRREALESLLQHPGWAIFAEIIQREWGDAGRRFEDALNNLANHSGDDATTVNIMRQIAVSRREVLRVLQLPAEELKKLAGKHEDRSELAGMSRRGGL